MKKILLFLILTIGCLASYAQDVIVKNDGSTVLCKIIGVNNTEVIYTKWSDADGPQYIIDRSLVSSINYQDGRQDKLNERTANVYAPGNQQSGEANYNDKALLALDYQRYEIDYLKKAKTLKTVGWSVGISGVVIGTTVLILGLCWDSDGGEEDIFIPLGSVLVGGGVGTAIGCLVKANQYAKKARMLASAPLFQHEFNFKDGSSLCAGIDMIRDKRLQQSTFGLGLQYNF